MVEERELFDLPVEAFVEAVDRWAVRIVPEAGPEVTWFAFEEAISVLAGLLWVLGQRVKKLEREE